MAAKMLDMLGTIVLSLAVLFALCASVALVTWVTLTLLTALGAGREERAIRRDEANMRPYVDALIAEDAALIAMRAAENDLYEATSLYGYASDERLQALAHLQTAHRRVRARHQAASEACPPSHQYEHLEDMS